MKKENKYIRQITERLSELNPYLVLLFGSYATGVRHEDSDIDLLVVTNDDFIPTTFKEKNDLFLSVNSKIRDIAQKVPVDLLVYTHPMYRKFVETGSSFSREILNKGIILYESNNKRMA
ncbi:MAG: DNA polymerase subunit beta [Bacteroidetes bacterium CG23_combo_of_CG06-09_8_20_14_all_32_9]|nr:MAG: DNA polymerase subunit beta [Bacteroidetes bacterium CG23_combo_of_CG06-09_8_20_14_all_32_9]